MMEEAADDANGDSTFEFVAVKDASVHSDSTEPKPVVTTVPTSFQPAMPPQTLTQSQAPLRPSPFQHTQLACIHNRVQQQQ
ncbi:hypothetical protein HPB52_004333 [Rhipicephalus sanguineus]|uniref:Uncharacterized protein n=1 Tax=Rhipicephalus sanguineus TaxID=34632 RepID=A0A9D4SY86_RHISA|nr:hypothetical protein HPB52_004333 [Rhipicephalus sanguineus]